MQHTFAWHGRAKKRSPKKWKRTGTKQLVLSHQYKSPRGHGVHRPQAGAEAEAARALPGGRAQRCGPQASARPRAAPVPGTARSLPAAPQPLSSRRSPAVACRPPGPAPRALRPLSRPPGPAVGCAAAAPGPGSEAPGAEDAARPGPRSRRRRAQGLRRPRPVRPGWAPDRDRAGHCSCTDRPQQPRHDLRERKLCLQHRRHCPPEW